MPGPIYFQFPDQAITNTMAYDPILESWVIMSSMHPNEVDEDPEEDTPIFVEEDK
jgi:hypothetical protein